MPDDNVDLHRLIWSPDDFENGRILTSAFRRQDLEGGDNYVSVSATNLLNVDAEMQIAAGQAASAGNTQYSRDTAWSALINCGDVHDAVDNKDVKPFAVSDEPLDDNLAHCGIRNATNSRGKGYVNQLRTILVSRVKENKPLSDFLSQFCADDTKS